MSADICAVLLVVGLFMLGVVSPGPNFIVVVERSLAAGFRAGLVTGVGVATGDAVYAAAGLLGLSVLVTQAGWAFGAIKLLGGLYIAWLGLRMLVHGRRHAKRLVLEADLDLVRCYRTGLLTDLSNPKTVVFFASIFAASYDPARPAWVAIAMWAGIVVASLTWRAGLATVFSRAWVRAAYERSARAVEAAFGVVLLALGLRLAVTGRTR